MKIWVRFSFYVAISSSAVSAFQCFDDISKRTTVGNNQQTVRYKTAMGTS